MTHLLNRKHFTAAKYINYLAEIIELPDYAGYYDRNIELVKIFKDSIYISIKLDAKKHQYYIPGNGVYHLGGMVRHTYPQMRNLVATRYQ